MVFLLLPSISVETSQLNVKALPGIPEGLITTFRRMYLRGGTVCCDNLRPSFLPGKQAYPAVAY